MSKEHTIVVLPTKGIFAEFRIVRQRHSGAEHAPFFYTVFGYGTPSEEYVRAAVAEIAIKTTLGGLLAHLTNCERELNNRASERVRFIVVSLKCIGAAIMDNYERSRGDPMSSLAVPDMTLRLWTSANYMGARAFLRYFLSFAVLHFDDDVAPMVPDYLECTIGDRLRAILDVFQQVVPYDLSDMRIAGIMDARVSRDHITITFRERIGAQPLCMH